MEDPGCLCGLPLAEATTFRALKAEGQNTSGPVAPRQLPIEGYRYKLCIALSRLLRGIAAGLQNSDPGSLDGELHLEWTVLF